MDRRLIVLVSALLLVGTAAHAQGGDANTTIASPFTKPVAANQIDMVGVVKAIGPEDRLTIAYEESQALSLPAGERSFVVAKMSLLKGVTVGERVRFRLDSQQVSVLSPFDSAAGQPSDGPNPGSSPPARAGTGAIAGPVF